VAWLRIDDRVRTHPKIVEAGPEAAWVWFSGICYCREHLTDGFIPSAMLASLVPGVNERKVRLLAAKLTEARLWHADPKGYRVHDFLDWNPSREQVMVKREEDRKRKEKGSTAPPSVKESTDFPVGKNTEAEMESVRIPGSRVRAGNGLGLGSSEDSDPRSAFPRKADRQHAGHIFGFCQFKCVSEEKLNEFAKDLPRGLDDPRNFDRVLAWAKTVRDGWGDKPKLEVKWFDFWEARWQERPRPASDDAIGRRGDAALARMQAVIEAAK
jgi:hypothetical protein